MTGRAITRTRPRIEAIFCMAVRGRRPKPTALKERLGNPGKRPLNDAEPQPQPASTRTPHGMSAGAKKFWRSLAADLVELGVLTAVDVPAFILMAEHYGVARAAVKELTLDSGELKLLVLDQNGMDRKHPLLQVLRDNSSAFRAFATEFGMTPSSRSRLKLAAPEEDDFMALLFGTDVEVSDDDNV